ncbi:MAG: alpha/beta hydrolase [Verrucomicrobiales bacterium]|nr:alpha/beta hydrolase [Verrucomicrobiales bacterium]
MNAFGLVLVSALTGGALGFEPAAGVKVDHFVPVAAGVAQVSKDDSGVSLRMAENAMVVQRGENRVMVDVWRPDDDRVLPGILMIHGGGWIGGSKEAFHPMAEALARRGWVVVATSYRLATEAPFPGAVLDVKASLRWMRAHASEWKLDPEKIGAVGGSAGGHLAGMIATTGDHALLEKDGPWPEFSSRLQAAVLMGAGVDQLQRARESAKPIPSQRIFFEGTVEEKEAVYREASPFHQLTKDCPPLLFMDGELDTPGQRYIAMRQRMDELGVPQRMVVIGGEKHGSWGRAPWLESNVVEIDRFLSQYLKAKPSKEAP